MANMLLKDYSSNLVANYKFSETSGTTCVDSKGLYNGIYTGTTSVTDTSQGISCTYRTFNGTSDYISFSNSVIPLGAKSIKFKIKTTQTSYSDGFGAILVNDSDSGTNHFILVAVQPSGKIFVSWSKSNDNLNVMSSKSVNDGIWHTILITYDNKGFIKIYIDDLINEDCSIQSINSEVFGYNLRIGRFSNVSGYYRYFKGELDEIEIYNDVVQYCETKYLIQDGNKLYTYPLKQIGETPLTDNLFKTHGVDDVSIIYMTEDDLNSLINPQIVVWCDNQDVSNLNINIQGLYNKNLIDTFSDDTQVLFYTDDQTKAPTKLNKNTILHQPFIKTLDKPQVLAYSDDVSYTPKIILNGNMKSKYNYTVNIQDPITNTNTELKNISNIDNDISDSALIPSSIFSQAINPYAVTVSMQQEDEFTITQNATVSLYDRNPFIFATMKGMEINAQIGDDDGDLIQYKVLLNGKQIHPVSDFTELTQSPVTYNRIFTSDEAKFGENNIVTIIAKDQFGLEGKVEVVFVGDYNGLMFVDETGKYYTTDLGQLLQYLDFGTIISGQNTIPKKVIVKNKNPFSVKNVRVNVDNNIMPIGVKIELSNSQNPFIPNDNLTFINTLNYNEQVEFYVRIATELYNAKSGDAIFEIDSLAEPI